MREKLSRRLMRLEEIHAAAVRAHAASSAPGAPSVAEIIREHLRIRGFVPTGNESLAETLARAFGMNSQELRHLMAGASGGFQRKAAIAVERAAQRKNG
jgi:hypothetical protein